MRKSLFLASVLFVASGLVSSTQAAGPILWHVYAGFSGTSGEAADYIADGWDFDFGGVWKPGSGPLGLRFDVGYGLWDVKVGNLPDSELRVDDGDASVFSLRLGPQFERDGSGRASFYGGLGVGGYRLRGQLTQTALQSGYVCDPWWGWCYPAVVEGEVVVEDGSTTKLGYYVNFGVAIEMTSGELFFEGQYHWVQTKRSLEYYPIVVGYRW